MELNYAARRCPVCDSENGSDIIEFSDQRTIKITEEEIDHVNFVCKFFVCSECGMAFINPSPKQMDLDNYYRHCFPHNNPEGDFDLNKRISYLARIAECYNLKSYGEIGANNSNKFHKALSEIFSSVGAMDINPACSINAKLNNCRYDIIALYYVLEHVRDVKEFLNHHINQYLNNEEGYVLIEVPDIELYYKDVSGLVWGEHVNHFSVRTLTKLMNTLGFSLVETSRAKCSRDFGFLALYKKATTKQDNVEYINNRDLLLQGSQLIDEIQLNKTQCFDQLFQNIEHNIDTSVLWCANDLLKDFLEYYHAKTNDYYCGLVIDETPAKKAFFNGYPRVFTSGEVIDRLAKAETLYIFSYNRVVEISNVWLNLSLNNDIYYVNKNYDLVKL